MDVDVDDAGEEEEDEEEVVVEEEDDCRIGPGHALDMLP